MNCDTTGEGVYMNVSLRGSQYNVFEVLISTGLALFTASPAGRAFYSTFYT